MLPIRAETAQINVCTDMAKAVLTSCCGTMEQFHVTEGMLNTLNLKKKKAAFEYAYKTSINKDITQTHIYLNKLHVQSALDVSKSKFIPNF